MKQLGLPVSTIINRAIPKNSFDKFTTPKQKKLLAEFVDKIRWINKLSSETINLAGKDVKEIQVFEISLKKKANIEDLLNLIDRSIPYHIVFIIRFEDQVKVSVSAKHQHPTNENTSVVDWNFNTDWVNSESLPITLNLKQNLDFMFTDLCRQISGKAEPKQSLSELIAKEQNIKALEKSIASLSASIKSSKQFNKTVELNIELQKKIRELSSINNEHDKTQN